MSVSRDNHYVPQLYLNNWGTNNKIYVHRLLVPHEAVPEWERCAIRTTAYIENLYVRIQDGEEYDDFELDFNGRFETPVKPILSKLCSDQKLTREEWLVLCDYITAQYVRTPSFYHYVASWGKKEVPDIVEKVLNKLVSVPIKPLKEKTGLGNGQLLPVEVSISNRPDDDLHSYLEVNTVVGKNLWLYIINHILTSDSPVKRAFREMKWHIVTAPPEFRWPTCDAPVVVTRMGQQGRVDVSNGFGNKDAVILFPVSPKKLLLGTHARGNSWHFEADIKLAQQLSEAIVNNALMYVYSSFEDPSVVSIRSRVVDAEEFKRQKKQYADWYAKYKTDEAPFLTKKRAIKREQKIDLGGIV